MPMTESERHELYEIAKNEVSDRFAELMINALPPDTDRLATKDDLAVLGSDLRTEIADLRTEMAELRLSVSTEIHEAFRAQTRTLVMGLVASVLLIALTNTLTVLVG